MAVFEVLSAVGCLYGSVYAGILYGSQVSYEAYKDNAGILAYERRAANEG